MHLSLIPTSLIPAFTVLSDKALSSITGLRDDRNPATGRGIEQYRARSLLDKIILEGAKRYMGLVKYFSNNDSHARPAPLQSPLHVAADILRRKGMQPDDMRIALTALTIMNSAYLGNALSLVIHDRTGHKAGIIDLVMQMVPHNRLQVMGHINQELIFNKEQPLKGCCLIVNDNKSFNNVVSHMDPLLGRGSATMRNPYKTRFGSGIEELRAEGPVSCIVLVKSFMDCSLTHPYILRVNAQGGANEYSEHLPALYGHASQDLFVVDAAMFKKNMELLKPGTVHVPFADDLSKYLNANGQVDRSPSYEVIHRLLISTTLMNNIKAPSRAKVMAMLYDVDEAAMANWLSSRGNENHEYKLLESANVATRSQSTGGRPLTATKYDYYLLWVLLDGIIVFDGNALTDRQIRILTAIRNINIHRATGRTFATLGTNTNILVAINSNPDSWTGRDSILKEVNQDGGGGTIPCRCRNWPEAALGEWPNRRPSARGEKGSSLSHNGHSCERARDAAAPL